MFVGWLLGAVMLHPLMQRLQMKEVGPGWYTVNAFFIFFPKALRRVLPENPLNTDTSTLTLTH